MQWVVDSHPCLVLKEGPFIDLLSASRVILCKMKILLVDAYEENKKGVSDFNTFYKIFVGLLRKTSSTVDNGVHDITVRRINCLSDIVLDWEHDIVPPNAEQLAKEFDKYHMVCVSGDMKFLPWEPFFFQAVTLIHMCHLMGKPIVTCGGGAFAAVYASATQGAKFYILNGAIGGSVEGLKQFPVYCPGTKANPCGYLDNETGDIYIYDTATRSWRGQCNVGIYRNASAGKPASTRFRPPTKKFTGLKRDHHVPDTANDKDTIVVIRNNALQHFALRKCESPNFVAKLVGDWFLNVEGGLPLQSGLEILAEGPNGPALLGKKRAFHIALTVDESFSADVTRDILFQYLKHTVSSIASEGSGRNLHDFLFESNKGITDAHKLSEPMAESLCPISTRSRVSGGPERVEVPLPSTFEVRVRTEEEVTAHLTSILHSTRLNVKKEPESVICNPRNQNRSRLLRVIGKYTGGGGVSRMAELMSDNNALDPGSLIEDTPNISQPSSPGKYRNQIYHNFGHSDDQQPNTGRKPATSSYPVMRDPTLPPDVDVKRPHTSSAHPDRNRLNWEKKWQNVRPHSSFEKKRVCDEKGRKLDTYTQITRRSSLEYLPIHHPRISTEVKKTVFRKAPSTKPFNSFSKYENMDDMVEAGEYEGQYKGGFLTPYERERKEYCNAKTKFLGGEFRNYFGVASQIPLRKEGLVRPFGAYPADIGYHKDKVRDKPFLPVKNLYRYRNFENVTRNTSANVSTENSELSI